MSVRRGLLVYQSEDLRRNRWFAETLCRYAEPEGLSLRLCLSENAFSEAKSADFVINRSRNHFLSEYCEETLGIPVYNNSSVTAVTNDKYKTYLFLRAHGLPCAETEQITEAAQRPAMPFPLVAKPPDGHGGAGVVWAAEETALREIPLPFLVQQPMQTGWDLRVYILGGKIYRAVLRTSETDFRSNFSLGGHAALFEPDAEIRGLVSRLLAVMPMDFAGIDFLRHPDGGYVIGEIEDAVGCRMLYQLTNLDPAKDFIRHIRDCVTHPA